ncbi:MAG: 2-oxo-4-hydroxy-4-carboxy-5-ureidoimidazoline decarboxylase [Comamonadaceae bacterium]
MALTLQQLNSTSDAEAAQMLSGLYEHSPWIAQAALAQRPFASLAKLKYALVQVLAQAGLDAQLALIRAHPELAGKAMISQTLTAESSNEQSAAGLTHCSAQEFARIQELNAAYKARFDFPFILAVRGPRGSGLTRREIIETFERRLQGQRSFEIEECLRNIHRIAELRLNDKFGIEPLLGNLVWDWAQALAQYSDAGYAENGQLTVTYLTAAHRACAAHLKALMLDCGFDEISVDAVGNVVGRYLSDQPLAKTLLTGSHFDTVRNAGKYDGRLGILVPMACVRTLAAQGRRLPFHIEVVAFAEEEGQRFETSFLGSSALVGKFDAAWLALPDADGTTLREAMTQAGLNPADVAALRRDPGDYLGFVEVHIEQGPVLDELNLPLGVVSSINGSVRCTGEVIGTACHAGTTPMTRRQDAAAAVAELILAVEKRAGEDADSVATVGQLLVPNGSTNVVPGRCQFTLDMRAPGDSQRNALVNDILACLTEICERRQLRYTLNETMRVAAAPSSPAWQQRWEQAIAALAIPLHRMPSGAGHDAMKLHEIMPQAMLFVRGQNAGVSHNPLESSTSDDMQLAVEAMTRLLELTGLSL